MDAIKNDEEPSSGLKSRTSEMELDRAESQEPSQANNQKEENQEPSQAENQEEEKKEDQVGGKFRYVKSFSSRWLSSSSEPNEESAIQNESGKVRYEPNESAIKLAERSAMSNNSEPNETAINEGANDASESGRKKKF